MPLLRARGICQSYGLEILSLDSKKEHDEFLKQAVKSGSPIVGEWFATGGIATKTLSVSDWYWMNSGEHIDYNLKWAGGEPNGASERCLWLRKVGNDFSFYDVGCEEGSNQSFICQTKMILA